MAGAVGSGAACAVAGPSELPSATASAMVLAFTQVNLGIRAPSPELPTGHDHPRRKA